jgi:hypothetical protein
MTDRRIRALVWAVILAAGFTLASARSAKANELLPLAAQGDMCFHFPLITVCCGSGGCYIKR